jgi:hypothetical protein
MREKSKKVGMIRRKTKVTLVRQLTLVLEVGPKTDLCTVR